MLARLSCLELCGPRKQVLPGALHKYAPTAVAAFFGGRILQSMTTNGFFDAASALDLDS